MRVVQTPARFEPAVGGVERYVRDLGCELVRRGHQVTVICADEPHSGMRTTHGIRVTRLPFVGKVANTNITPSLLASLLREGFDVVHTHYPTPWAVEMSLLAARLRGKPCVITYHNDVEKAGVLGILARLYTHSLLRLALRLADRILVTHEDNIERSSILGRYINKISVIPNGVTHLERVQYQTRSPDSLLFVSVLDRYHRYKGLEYLIEAMAQVRRARPAVRLHVVGKGDLLPEYQALVERLNLQDHVQFLGYVSDEELVRLYRTSAVFVLSSVDAHEGFGIVLLEAMSYATPVVTTTAPGISGDIARHRAGLVVAPQDSEALAEAICEVLACPNVATEYGDNGLALVRERYYWPDICVAVERIYTDVAQRPRTSIVA